MKKIVLIMMFVTVAANAQWVQFTNGLDSSSVNTFAYTGNTLYAGKYSGGVYLSTNNGANWTQAGLSNRNVNVLAVNGVNIFAGTYGSGVFLSTNNGTSWTQTLNNEDVRTLAVSGNNIFAGTHTNGVYVSNNNGVNWVLRNEGLNNTNMIAMCRLNNYMFVATTFNHNVYRRPLNELIGITPISTEIPEQFSLSQNYPNPFNPTTNIIFAIPVCHSCEGRNPFVSLKVFDILGKEIATLVNNNLKAGTYKVDFDGTNYPSGVYYYKLSATGGAGDFNETKKMILIK